MKVLIMPLLPRLVFMICYLLPAIAQAQLASESVRNDYSTARLVSEQSGYKPGKPFWIALHLDMVKGWHTYWQNPGDSGYATSVKLTLPDGVTASDIHWPAPIRFEMSGIVNYGYKEESWHFLHITPSAQSQGDIQIKAEANWLICEEICVPESASLQLMIPQASSDIVTYADVAAKRESIPVTSKLGGSFYPQGKDIIVMLPDADLQPPFRFFPLDNNILSNETLPIIETTEEGFKLRYKKGQLEADSLRAVIHLPDEFGSGGAAYEMTFIKTAAAPDNPAPAASGFVESASPTLLIALVSAFLGGIILNLMPCVLPVLSIKAFSLVKTAKTSPLTARLHGLAYTLGVLLCFTVIALALIALKSGGEQIGWGFQLQSPAFVAALALLMLLVALNLAGLYEMPSFTFGSKAASASHYSGSFFTGVLAVLVATPCTAPFMASAVGFALSQPPIILLSIFLSLGLGLALPFLLISFIPAFARLLPKPGNWMVTFRQFLAFPMLATAAWLMWVLTRQAGTDALAFFLTLALIISLLVWWGGRSTRRAVAYACTALILITLVAGLNHIRLAGQAGTQHIELEAYSAERLQALRDDGKPVFVYATADWCITCKINEKLALNTEEVRQHFDTLDITVLQADWTDYDANITAYLKSHDRAGVPVYVYYAPQQEGVLLPQLLTPSVVKEYVK